MRMLVACCFLLAAACPAGADPSCAHHFMASENGLEVNGTHCDHSPLPGVKAICRDGWQSFHTGRGTCSHHGGIAKRVK